MVYGLNNGAAHSAAHKHGCYKFDVPQDGTIFDTLDASNLFPKHPGENLSEAHGASFAHP